MKFFNINDDLNFKLNSFIKLNANGRLISFSQIDTRVLGFYIKRVKCSGLKQINVRIRTRAKRS